MNAVLQIGSRDYTERYRCKEGFTSLSLCGEMLLKRRMGVKKRGKWRGGGGCGERRQINTTTICSKRVHRRKKKRKKKNTSKVGIMVVRIRM